MGKGIHQSGSVYAAGLQGRVGQFGEVGELGREARARPIIYQWP